MHESIEKLFLFYDGGGEEEAYHSFKFQEKLHTIHGSLFKLEFSGEQI